jgi:hypothetical protein
VVGWGWGLGFGVWVWGFGFGGLGFGVWVWGQGLPATNTVPSGEQLEPTGLLNSARVAVAAGIKT